MTATTATATPSVVARHAPMSVFGAAALVAGSMIGSGVYLLPASLGAMGSISILGWCAATAVALVLAGAHRQRGPASGARGRPQLAPSRFARSSLCKCGLPRAPSGGAPPQVGLDQSG